MPSSARSRAAEALALIPDPDPAQEVNGSAEEEEQDSASDDEEQWDWIYAEASAEPDSNKSDGSRKRKATEKNDKLDRKIIGAQRGGFKIYVGDAVMLKAERNETWVALISEFVSDEDLDDDKSAVFMWFSSPKEIRNREKRRADALAVCSKLVKAGSRAIAYILVE